MTTPATSDSPAPDTALARSQAARRRRVLDAALRLAERGGFDAVQMRDVATEANVALGTVYRYFTSKERLLLEAMVEEIEALAARLESRPPVGATPADRVVDVLSRGTASLQRHPEVTAAMVRAFGAADEADVVRRVGDIMTGIITGVMHEGPPSARDLAVARTLQQVWLSSLIGWVGGVDDPPRVVADLETATQLLLGDGAIDGAAKRALARVRRRSRRRGRLPGRVRLHRRGLVEAGEAHVGFRIDRQGTRAEALGIAEQAGEVEVFPPHLGGRRFRQIHLRDRRWLGSRDQRPAAVPGRRRRRSTRPSARTRPG